MDIEQSKNAISCNETYLGIELGSTRIKAVLIDKANNQIASGSHTWENRFENGFWTYSLDDIWNGLRDCYSNLSEDVLRKYDMKLKSIGAMGISAMMHGFIVVGKDNKLLTPFRTWRNTTTEKASKCLTELFGFNVPQRWNVAHLYQAILNLEPYVSEISYLTTLAGYVHWQLTGEKVIGIGDASGMFPIDDETKNYNAHMLEQFDELNANKGLPWKLVNILPKVLLAGEEAGMLTEEGAKLIDPSGILGFGIPLCPPEGDAGTGMVATNSVRKRTGNISAGTSVFAMVVLERPLKKAYPEIDMVTTPSGNPVAMVHCNNFTSDIDAWVKLLGEAATLLGAVFDTDTLYTTLYNQMEHGEVDCGGLISYNYISGEPVTKLSEGRPLFMRLPDAKLSLANFMRTHLYSACASLKIGMDILLESEHTELDSITGHGGFFKVPRIGQRVIAAALKVPVSVMATAGEGGPWGIALLASFMVNKQENESLEDFLLTRVFAGKHGLVVNSNQDDVEGFNKFMDLYKKGLIIEKTAVDTVK